MRVFSKCRICKRGMVRVDLKTGKQTPTKSAYPVCLGCLLKNTKDPNFNQWLGKITHANQITNNNANPAIKPKPEAEKVFNPNAG